MAQFPDTGNALADIGDQLPIGLLRVDRQQHCLYVNQRWCNLTGIDSARATGEGWLGAVADAERTQLVAQLNALIDGGAEFESSLPNRGDASRLSWRWQIECDRQGATVGAIAAVTSIAPATAPTETEQRYRSVFEGSGDAMFLMRDQIFIDCNQATLQMFGCARAEIVGRTPMQFSPAEQADGRLSGAVAQEKIHDALTGERQHFEWIHRRFDGTPFDAEVTLTSITIDDQPLLLASVRDISARKQFENESRRNYLRIAWRNKISVALHNVTSIEDAATRALAVLNEISSAHLIGFYYIDRDTGFMNCVAESGTSAGRHQRTYELRSAETSSLARMGKYVFIDDVSKSPLPAHYRQTLLDRNTRYACLLPLMNGDQPIGLIFIEYAEKPQSTVFTVEDLLGFVSMLELALKNIYHLAELDYRASHDSLTQLPNRSVLQRELSTALVSGNPLTLMLLDLDRFKEINDTLGHHTGDRLLCELGARLQRKLSAQATLCRLGGDEFAILQRDCTLAQGLEFAREVLHTLQQSYEIDGMMLEIGASIGVAAFPEHGTDYHGLLRAADVAMYGAKTQSIGVAAYAAALDAHTPERLRLMTELGNAIRSGELVLHYQPKIHLRNSGPVVSGFEALVRWQHPREGLLPPAAFMPFAEVSDAIHALTLEVIRQALAQQIIWRTKGLPATIAVNLSTRNLLHARFFDEVMALIKHSGADPRLLEFEITETSLMHDSSGAAALLTRFAALGINIAVDDFGTGYSSLAYLRRLPLHALKIDRAFVQELSHNAQDQVIVRSIVALAHNLDLHVIAEGVEDAATLTLLRELGCDGVQGFLFARPQPAAAITQWLNDFDARY